MSVRAKFKVESKTDRGETAEVCLKPVVGGSEENESFYRYTPWGELTLGGLRQETAARFAVGQEVYLDITPVT